MKLNEPDTLVEDMLATVIEPLLPLMFGAGDPRISRGRLQARICPFGAVGSTLPTS